jgi:signal peptidase I
VQCRMSGSLQEEPRMIHLIGSSMNPVLRDGDRLYYLPYKDRETEPGDVVVINPANGKKVIHRVLSTDSLGIRTGGDNSLRVDPWILERDQIVGKVVYAIREGKRLNIHGGLRGRVFSAPRRAIRRLMGMSFWVLEPPYHFIARAGIPGFPSLRPKVLAFQRPEGPELHLSWRGKIIGRKLPGKEWWIRPPYRLFLKEDILLGESDSRMPD